MTRLTPSGFLRSSLVFAIVCWGLGIAPISPSSYGEEGNAPQTENQTDGSPSVTETENLPTVRLGIDATRAQKRIGNKLSNINVWSLDYLVPKDKDEGADLSEFVEYVQLMQATGGSNARDLLKDPNDRSVLDDYDFEPLYRGCQTVLDFGARPHIKFGVPTKFSSRFQKGEFETNVFPPDHYDAYERYVRALARGLVERFGREEVRKWRFGVLTEFENQGWFQAESGDPAESRDAYCKLYDWTVEALIAELGSDIFVGAHAMGCSEGLWDPRDFITHCAVGTNDKTGRTGTRLCFIATSYYGHYPGFLNVPSLASVVDRLRERAEEVGLTNLIYGVDEGRLLYGVHSGNSARDLLWRVVGDTYEASFDARLLKEMTDHDIDYFSAWSYSSGKPYHGYPTVSYHTARYFSAFRNANSVPVEKLPESGDVPPADGEEIDAVAGFEPASGELPAVLRVMIYHFQDSLDAVSRGRGILSIRVPEFAGKRVKVVETAIDDRVNFFDDWRRDRETYGIGDDRFMWSPDDPGIDHTTTLNHPEARKIYEESLRPNYVAISQTPPQTTREMEVGPDGVLTLEMILDHHAVHFLTLTLLTDQANQ